MARTPKRLAGPAQLTNAAATIYTTPASTTTIVRNVQVQNPAGGSAQTFTLSIGSDAAPTRVMYVESVESGGRFNEWEYYVLEAGEFLQAYADVGSVLVMTVDGDEVTAGGGGFQTAHTETNFGAVTTVNPGTQVPLPFGTIGVENGGTIIEVSDPLKPTVLAAGIYSVTMEMFYAGGAAVGYMQFDLYMDRDVNQWATSASFTCDSNPCWTSLSMTTYLDAGAVIQGHVDNVADADGDFNLGYCEIQRIT